jgi:tol-pal system protein YbgF
MKRSIIFILLPVVLIALAAPPVYVYAVKKDTRLILDELRKLATAIQTLDEKVDRMSTGMAALAQRVKLIEEKVTAISRSNADVSQDRESLKLSLQFIKEEINEVKNAIRKVIDQLANMPVAVPGTAENPGGGESEQQTPAQSPQTTYYTAYSDYIKKNYSLAVEGFKQFLTLFPDNNLADNSLYWIGECYYSQKKYQDAVDTFTQLITNYSDGDKIPDAILKKGYALIEMGRQTDGVEVLKELISRFPLSEEASLAQQKIKDVLD